MRNLKTIEKVVLSGAALTVAAGIAGVGTYADWSQTRDQDQVVESGDFQFDLGDTTSTFSTDITNFVPGDSAQRVIDLVNDGDVDYDKITVASVGTTDLSDSSVDALHVVIDECSVAWTAGTGTELGTYTCAGSSASLLSSKALDFTETDLGTALAQTSDSDGVTSYLRVTTSLPAGNDDYETYGDLDETVSYTFKAYQRDAEVR